MKRLRPALLLGLITLTGSLHAATTPAGRTEDLGQGLTYVRPAADNADSLALFTGVSNGPAVLDLRYFSSGDHAADWLAAIKTSATRQHLCLVLVSPEIAPELASALTAGIPGCVTIGRASPALKADITVTTTAETDRQAWESLGKGADVGKLITAVIDKPRYDEAVLAKEHAAEINGDDTASADDDAATPEKPADDKDTKAPEKPKPLTDAVLQRAVQIDRGLLALKKI
ncbi:MAG TPA: hypothetical protein VL357_13595 [Rariglobus sp.]|jgi:hypothetical protein|nr:hypothetical protein [Rariglobus sp.]